MFRPNTLFYSDGYKVGHKRMLAQGTTRLAGTWIPRSLKHAPKGVKKIVSMGQQLVWRWIHDEFQENFFNQGSDVARDFAKDMSLYLGMEYDGKHFEDLHNLQYLPIRVKSLPEGIETQPNITHMTFINTVDGFAWLTLYLETIVSALAWKTSTSATIALQYRRNLEDWVEKTDKNSKWLIPFLCHDFSARGLDPFSMLASGLGHASSFRGSDTLIVIPGARYFYGEPKGETCINSVNASEHSVSTTKIFTVGEKQMIIDWLKEFPKGILSIVADTFDLWKLIMEYLQDPEVKELIMARDGKLVIRPDSGDPVDIVCGMNGRLVDKESHYNDGLYHRSFHPQDPLDRPVDTGWNETVNKGVIELLWDIFGGTVNDQGYKVLDSHIGAIYGDSITLERQVQIYSRLEQKGFACTNIVLGIGSYTYQLNTRDTFGFAAKGSWFEVEEADELLAHGLGVSEWSYKKKGYEIYKDPVTDDGTKTSLKGLCAVMLDAGEYHMKTECTEEEERQGILQVIYEDGKFPNLTTLTKIRENINSLVNENICALQ